jgi:molybdopterin molybdotransferase
MAGETQMSLLPVDEAIARIVEGITPLAVEQVRLDDALGRTLAEPLAATRTQPPFPASAMDGFAVRAADTEDSQVRLKIIGMSAAGHSFGGTVNPGEAVRISTGAPVPAGADAILIKENADTPDDNTLVANQPALAGKHIRRPGLDFDKGDILIQPGTTIGVRQIALAAAMNHATVPVRRKPRIAILATGDELVHPGANPGPDQIIASNDRALAGFARQNGADPHDLGIVIDDETLIGDAIDEAISLPADILVTLGGASVGDHDLVQSALSGKGMELDFWRIAMRPGKPLMFGRLGETRILGLPGNPVSSIVCALLFLKPLIASLLGEPVSDPSEPALLGSDMKENDDRQDYIRATLSTETADLPKATTFSQQDSSGLVVLAEADCLILRPPHAPPAKAGDACRIIRLGGAALV